MPALSTPQTIPDVTKDSETGSGSGLGRNRDNGIFDQIRANDAVYFCFGSETDGRRRPRAEVQRLDHTAIKRSSALSPYRVADKQPRFSSGPLKPLVRRSPAPGPVRCARTTRVDGVRELRETTLQH